MNIIIKIVDVFLIATLLLLIVNSYGSLHPHYPLIGFSAAVFYILLSEVVYANINSHSTSPVREVTIMITLWAVVISAAIVSLFLFKQSSDFSRFVIITWSVLVPIVLSTWHFIARHYISNRSMQSGRMPRAVIIGSGELSLKVKHVFKVNPQLGFKVIGGYDDRQDTDRNDWGKDLLGDFQKMMEDAKNHKFDVAFIALQRHMALHTWSSLRTYTPADTITIKPLSKKASRNSSKP